MDNREIEVKIKLSNAADIISRAESLGAVKKPDGEGLERDVMYDDGKGFFDAHRVLRLRVGPSGNYITYKEKLKETEHAHLLRRVEIETKVSDPEQTDLLFKALGFTPHRIKEKITNKFLLDGLVLEFHKLPFIGDFMEIEGSEDQLKNFLPKLGLGIEQGINNDYTGLFYEYCDDHGLSRELPQTFEEEKKHGQKN